MRLELRYRSDIDLSQPAMQVEIRSHIARCLRDYPQGGEGVITLAGVEHCFMYVVHDDVVDTVIGPPDYIEQVLNERRQNTHEARSPLPRKENNYPVRGLMGLQDNRGPRSHRSWPTPAPASGSTSISRATARPFSPMRARWGSKASCRRGRTRLIARGARPIGTK